MSPFVNHQFLFLPLPKLVFGDSLVPNIVRECQHMQSLCLVVLQLICLQIDDSLDNHNIFLILKIIHLGHEYTKRGIWD